MNKEDFLKERGSHMGIVIGVNSGEYKGYELLCFVEGGDDKSYYAPKIMNLSDKSCFFEIVNNKKSVIKLYKTLKKYGLLEKKMMFFVDRDFDDKNSIKNIYETPCYSIENFYTTSNCFEKILNTELHCNIKYINTIKGFFEIQKDIFHNETLILNQWAYTQRKKETGKNFSHISGKYLANLIDIDHNSISFKKSIKEFLEEKYPQIDINEPKIIKKKFNSMDLEFRGKFEIAFFLKYLGAISKYIEETGLKSGRNKSKDFGNRRGDFLSVLSQYSDTPQCLKNYILEHSA